MQYWIIVNEEPTGPFDLEIVRGMGLDSSTPVWHTGLRDWTPAAEIPELADTLVISSAIPVVSQPTVATEAVPDIPAATDAPGDDTPPPSYLGWSIAAMLLCCIPTGIAAIIYSSKVNSAWTQGRHDDARRYSEIVEWLLMITIVAGLVWAPFSFLPSLL